MINDILFKDEELQFVPNPSPDQCIEKVFDIYKKTQIKNGTLLHNAFTEFFKTCGYKIVTETKLEAI